MTSEIITTCYKYYSVESPPPPSRPPKGIIKNKFKNIGEGLRRLKKQRVQIKTGEEK